MRLTRRHYWLLVAGSVLGLVVGFYSFLRSVLPVVKDGR